MVNKKENMRINNELKKIYEKNKEKHLDIWKECYCEKPPTRINEFGIIDINRYETKNGILVIGRETNGVEGWFNNNSDNDLFINWMREISINGLKNQDGCVKKHPNIWYNTARYILTVRGEKDSYLDYDKDNLLNILGTVAFTNINKVGGSSSSGKSYWKMYKKPDVIKLIVEEIEIIKPRYIILCDKYFAKFLTVENAEKLFEKECPALKECIENNRLYVVPHPAARISKEKMLNELEKQIKGE